MAFNFAELKEAFSAAVKSTAALNEITPSESKAEEANPEEDGEDNFLHRLHLHSTRLSDVVDAPLENNHLSLFSSPNKRDDGFKSNPIQSGPKNDYDNRIPLELSPVSVAKLNELFGDVPSPSIECVSPVEVHLPIWLCELLFKATQKMTISNTLREEYEQQNDLLAYDYLASFSPNKKCQREDKSVSLRRLYEMFPTLSKKVISRVAKELNFDFERTALYLVDYSDDHPTDPSNTAKDDQNLAKHSKIVPSLCPRVISAEEQQQKKAVAMVTNSENNKRRTTLLQLPPESWDTEVQHVEVELRNIVVEQKHCREMRTKYVGFKNSNILGFYSVRANELDLARKALTRYWDRLRIWRTSSEECIDLHEISAERAISVVTEKINICRERHPNICKLYVITGYGKTTGIAVIKPRLMAFLRSKGIEARVSPKNEGVVEISLRGIVRHIE